MMQAAAMLVCSTCGAENESDARYCKSCGAALAGHVAEREQRKVVTALFCDVVGSTTLGESRDPEAVRVLLARYFGRIRGIVEAHGGTVQKFIGDAVVAIFGVPAVHEDDALRALRAAEEMRQALPELGVEARFGVNTGEVVTSSDDTLVTGDAINVAARLQQAAGSGEVLLGEATRELAGTAVRAEELDALVLKGKAEPFAAFRLVSVGEVSERSHSSRFVGREVELALLRAAWERAGAETRSELVTVVGEPGVGKSRLIAEFTTTLDTRVVQGRCLSYGQGITYYPVIGVVKQLGAVDVGPDVAATIDSLIGASDAASSPDEIAWAFRKLLEAAGREQPLVVVFDDIQWGEETFLDLIEHVALFSTGTSMLILCLARPELTERRPQWPVTLRLQSLPASQVEELLPASLPESLRRRIAHAAGGNPLFVTEMVAMAAEASDKVVVPPTLKALLAARIDRLEAAERGVLERGAVEGEVFHRGSVQALVSAGSQVTPQLSSLVRRELIRPARAIFPGEDGFRFCHLLMRDAAYDALPKTTRAELHERFADWLERHGAELVTRDELVGYHLQEAYRYRTELGDPDSITGPLAERAAASLADAGRRASARGDVHAAANLLERSLALGVTDARARVQLQAALGAALNESGNRVEADVVLRECYEAAVELGERGAAAYALVYLNSVVGDPNRDLGEMQAASEQARQAFAELGDDRGLALAERLLGSTLLAQGHREEGDAVYELSLVHAQASGDVTALRRAVLVFLNSLTNGPTPVETALDRCNQLARSVPSDRVLEALVMRRQGLFHAMAGDPEIALELVGESSAVLDERNLWIYSWLDRGRAAYARELAGDRFGAEREWLARWQYFSRQGDRSKLWVVSSAYNLGLLYCDEGRWDEAEQVAAKVRDVQLGGGVSEVALRFTLEARLAANDGRLEEAVALAGQATAPMTFDGVVVADRSWHGDARALAAAAEVLSRKGEGAAAEAAFTKAHAIYMQKGNVAAANRLRSARV
jgi:class 3 adenylate cyclase/tetratricopeptide (TPR) repeat protein